MRVFPWASMRAMVLRPSAKSCPMTARATARPALLLTWNPSPMATPSAKLWPARASALASPTAGWSWVCGAYSSQWAWWMRMDFSTTWKPRKPTTSATMGSMKSVPVLFDEARDLGEHVEGDDAEDDSGSEAQDEVEPVLVSKRHEPAEQRRGEGGQRQQDDHSGPPFLSCSRLRTRSQQR